MSRLDDIDVCSVNDEIKNISNHFPLGMQRQGSYHSCMFFSLYIVKSFSP